MSLVKQVVFGLIICGLMFAGGFYAGSGRVEVQEITKEGKSETIYRDRIVTVTKTILPDGTVTETTKNEDRTGSTTNETKSNEKLTIPALAQWSLGAGLERQATFDSVLSPKLGDYYVSGGMRALGPVWVETQYQPSGNEIRLGIRVEL